ncbi:MAG: iron-containing alcohol dehydrogenase [Spirochaetales bacterium]|nr:iron-containing alcohol dehydrogenase [Spirochaetales bacterium]
MQNFTYNIPTIINFGIDQLSHLADLRESGDRVLYVYGGGSIKANGLYDRSMKILRDAGLEVYELAGIEPNPRIQTIREGVNICRNKMVDMVLAVGGGSVIDSAKVIAAGACYDGDPWDLVIKPELISECLPIYTVLTIAATGSEMDTFAVISDLTKNEKWGTWSDFFAPRMSILDPTLTYSVPRRQTSAGVADIMSHTLENYFNNEKGAYLQARLAEGILKTLINYGPIALEQPDNYEARANLMWSSSLAINGLLSCGSNVGWAVHPMEHELSAFYDITHGEGLAILTPHFLEFALNKDNVWKYVEYAKNVFGITEGTEMEIARDAIRATKDFFKRMRLPSTLSELGIDDEYFDIMAEKAAAGCFGTFVELTKDDIISIFRASL